jgi:hypothetical protein
MILAMERREFVVGEREDEKWLGAGSLSLIGVSYGVT